MLQFISTILDQIATDIAEFGYAPALDLIVVPAILFFWLLRLRDSVDVPHIPYADLVSLIAILDIGLFVHPDVFKTANWYIRDPVTPERTIFAILFVTACVVARSLVVYLEKAMAPIMIQEMDVGFSKIRRRFEPPTLLRHRFNRNWRAYSWRYFVSWLAVTSLVAVHLVLLADPLKLFVGPLRNMNKTGGVFELTIAATIAAFLLNVILTAVGYIRFKPSTVAHYTDEGRMTSREVS